MVETGREISEETLIGVNECGCPLFEITHRTMISRQISSWVSKQAIHPEAQSTRRKRERERERLDVGWLERATRNRREKSKRGPTSRGSSSSLFFPLRLFSFSGLVSLARSQRCQVNGVACTHTHARTHTHTGAKKKKKRNGGVKQRSGERAKYRHEITEIEREIQMVSESLTMPWRFVTEENIRQGRNDTPVWKTLFRRVCVCLLITLVVIRSTSSWHSATYRAITRAMLV